MKEKNIKGITLVALAVTIVILLILSGITISVVFSDNGIIEQAKIKELSQELFIYKENMEIWSLNKSLGSKEFDGETLTGYKDKIYYTGKPEDSNEGIKDILGDVNGNLYGKLEIIKGELYITTTDKIESKAAEIAEVKIVPYDIKDGVLLSTGNNLSLQTGSNEVIIPASVTSIGVGAFANVENLTSITIPGTVKRIEDNAFAYNTSLVNVTMEDGVEYIGYSAFTNCTSIKTVKIPNTVTYIGGSAFLANTALEQVNISSNLKCINSYTFDYCRSLKELTIPEGIEEIATHAFAFCTSLTTVNLPSTLTKIDGTAFANTAVNNIVLAEGNTSFKVATNSIGETTMLLGNGGTEMSIILDNAVKDGVFTVPNGVTALRISQISTWGDIITTVNIPASVNYINGGFFTNKISEVNIDSSNPEYTSNNTEKAVYKKIDGVEKELVRYYGTEEEVTVKEGIERIKESAFNGNTIITKLTLPDSVVTMEGWSVSGAWNLKNLRIGKNLEGLTNTSIYNSAIENIDLGGNTRYRIGREGIGGEAKCNGVESKALYTSDGTVLISPLKNSIQTYEIPEGVTKIERRAFYGNTNLTQITIPDGIKSLEPYCFDYCSSLTSIEIPSSIETIGEGCFDRTSNLKTIRIHKKNGEVTGAPWGSPFGNDGKAIVWDN